MYSVNAFIILIAAHRSNAMKIVELARGFINKEKRMMRIHWGHLKFVHNKIFTQSIQYTEAQVLYYIFCFAFRKSYKDTRI